MPPKKGRGKKPAPKKKKAEDVKFVLPKQIGVWVWAQCDNAGCQKWRKLPPGTVINDNEPWFCYMNPNEEMNDCNIPEEEYNMNTEAAIYSAPASQAHSEESEPDDASWDSQNESRGKRSRTNAKSMGRASGGLLDGSVDLSLRRWSSRNKDDFQDGQARFQEEEEEVDDGAMWREVPQGKTKTKKAHLGFNKLLACGGSWDDSKDRVKALTMTPSYVWEAAGVHAPDLAQLACEAVDTATAAKYFEQAGGASSAQQVTDTTEDARLALSVAAAMGMRSTSQVPGVEPRLTSFGPSLEQPPQLQPDGAQPFPGPMLEGGAAPNSQAFASNAISPPGGLPGTNDFLFNTFNIPPSSSLALQPSLDGLSMNNPVPENAKGVWRPNGMSSFSQPMDLGLFPEHSLPPQQSVPQSQGATDPLSGVQGSQIDGLNGGWSRNFELEGFGSPLNFLQGSFLQGNKLPMGSEGMMADHNFFQQDSFNNNNLNARMSPELLTRQPVSESFTAQGRTDGNK